MGFSRLPRFKRVIPIAAFKLTERDGDIMRLVQQHRFLRSTHIIALIGGSRQPLLRRLQLLYHHGYLERPRAQIDTYHQNGSRPIVYGLGNQAVKILEPPVMPRWGEKNRSVGRIFLEHSLLVSDVMVTIELACRKAGNIKFIPGHQLLTELKAPYDTRRFAWKVRLIHGSKLGVVPDAVFALAFPDQQGARQRAYYFLEADRGTMPVQRRHLHQTSFYRKLLAYEATWAQSLHRQRFGFHRFRVLTVTTSAKRVQSIVNACSQLKSGQGLFLFADRTVLTQPDKILFSVWQTAQPNIFESLLN